MKLQTKFLVAFIPVLFLSGGCLTYLAKRAIHRILLEEVARRGWSQLQSLEPGAVAGFRLRKERLLLPKLEWLCEQAGAMYAEALDPDGRVLAHTNLVEKGKVYSDPVT